MQFEGLPPSHGSAARGWPVSQDGMISQVKYQLYQQRFPLKSVKEMIAWEILFELVLSVISSIYSYTIRGIHSNPVRKSLFESV